MEILGSRVEWSSTHAGTNSRVNEQLTPGTAPPVPANHASPMRGFLLPGQQRRRMIGAYDDTGCVPR